MTLKKFLLRLSIGIIIVLAIVCGAFYYLFFGIPNNAKKTSQEDNVAFRTQAPPDYLRLINSKNLVLEGSFCSDKRNPVSEFSYYNQYNIWIYKFPDFYRSPVKSVVKERCASTSLTTFIRYINVVNDSLNMSKEPISILYVSGRLDKLTDINLNLSGKDYRTIEKNDTVAYYNLKLNNFSITNNLNGDNIIYADANDKLKYKVPVELMFLKKSNSIYLIIMTVKGDDMELERGMLHKLVFKN
jgi:hypothetical protein